MMAPSSSRDSIAGELGNMDSVGSAGAGGGVIGIRQHPLLVLEQLSSQCVELFELRLICEQVCTRFTVLATHLEDASHSHGRPTDQDSTVWQARVESLIAQFAGFVGRNARNNVVRRLTDVHRLRELYELQVEMDAVFRATRSEHVDVAHNWQLQWQKDVEFAEQQLQRAVLSRELLRRELRDQNQQREALALVKFAAENLQLMSDRTTSSNLLVVEDDDPEYRASRVLLCKRVFRTLLGIAAVEVPVIPEWFISPNDVAARETPFSSSSNTDIYYGEWLPLAKIVIIKQLPKDHQNSSSADTSTEAFMHEALMWYPLNHPNVLKIVGGCHVSTPPFLVYECPAAESQTLDEYILSASLSPSSSSQCLVFHLLYQASQGLQYVHEQQKLVHNDLKCRNILVSADGKAKLCNFARASPIDASLSHQDLRILNAKGSLRWTSPEALTNGKIGLATDIYGLGMCVLEAVTGDIPWGFLDDQSIKEKIVNGELPELSDDLNDSSVDPDVWMLIRAMCAFDPESRPEIANVVEQLRLFAEKEHRQSRDAAAASASFCDPKSGGLNQQQMAAMNPADYSNYRRRLSHSRGSMSDTRSVSSDSSSTLSKDDAAAQQQQQRVVDTVSIVTLHQKWLGIKINSIGTKIVVSKFLRSASGAMGEIEASGSVQLGDTIYAVNNQTVRGMNRHQIGAFIQSTPRPLQLSFRREAGLLDDCFRFHGLRLEERWRDRGSALPLPGSLDRLFGSTTGCFSFEIWFSLASVPDSFLGGVLLGAQDIPVEDNSWAYIHKQMVIVDPHGNLCCSLFNSETPALIARELAPSIWYHLVVTYSINEKQLAVYLDGELRHSASGSLHRDWMRLRHANIGSGCISGLSPAKPAPDFTGWYGFNGLISDFKVWRALLGDLEVHQLFRGATDCVDIPSYSMRRDFRKKPLQGAQYPERVRATRPQHVVAQVY